MLANMAEKRRLGYRAIGHEDTFDIKALLPFTFPE
jgi:hypothetical protein